MSIRKAIILTCDECGKAQEFSEHLRPDEIKNWMHWEIWETVGDKHYCGAKCQFKKQNAERDREAMTAYWKDFILTPTAKGG